MEEEKTLEQLEKKYAEKAPDYLMVKSVQCVNFNPHPFMIGTRHIKAANENYRMGRIDKEVMEEVGCAHKGCNLPLSAHKYDKVLFLQLKRNVDATEINKWGKELISDLTDDKIDGITFVETDEKYRITEDKDDGNN
jgi:hypothetical protein